ncbi:PAS domain-containing protein [Streptomyces sp. NPDC051207]|uniref:PAS domain-containing protein n=1 Tax=Streptomyces sp. NPDC051207 TaxID=3154641 RepID=UPI003426B279
MSSRPSRGAARLAAILDALPDALVLVNANGTVVNANTIALEAFETPGTALVGRGLLDLLPQFDSKLIPGSMRRPDHIDPRARTKPTRMVARRTDGTEFPVEVTSANLENGQQAYDGYGYTSDELLMLVVRDLSGTVDTEAELARSQRQTEMILRAASEGVVGTDTEGRIVLVNPAAAQILGYRASDLGGRELHTLVLHSRPDGSPFPYEESPLADTLRSGRKHRVRGQVVFARNGDKVPVDLTTAPVRDGDQLVGAVLTFTDRRPYDAVLKEKETAEREHAEELERLAEEHASELTALRQRHVAELEELREQHAEEIAAGEDRYAALGEREKDRYEALAARHEQLLTLLGRSLRGPLEELRRELATLAADDAGQLWPEANQVLHHLSAGYSRITTLIDNVLGYQQLDTGAQTIARTKVMLDAVVASGVDGAVELIGPGRVQFAVHAPPIEAEVDPRLLATALAHLVADVAGVDSTGNAPVSAGGYMDNTVVVAAAQRGEVVRIEVRGPYAGGDPVHQPIVRGIVRAHGGVLQTHEVPGMSGNAYVLEVPIGGGAGVVPTQVPALEQAQVPGDASGAGAEVVPAGSGAAAEQGSGGGRRRARRASVDAFLDGGARGASSDGGGDGDDGGGGAGGAVPSGPAGPTGRRRRRAVEGAAGPGAVDSGAGAGSGSGSGSGAAEGPGSGSGAGAVSGSGSAEASGGTGRRRGRPAEAAGAPGALSGGGAAAEGAVVTAAEHAAGTAATGNGLGGTVPPQGVPAPTGRRARRDTGEQHALPPALPAPSGDSAEGAQPTGRRRRALAAANERAAAQEAGPRTVFALPPADADRVEDAGEGAGPVGPTGRAGHVGPGQLGRPGVPGHVEQPGQSVGSVQGQVAGAGQVSGPRPVFGAGQAPGQGPVPGQGRVPGRGPVPGQGSVPGQGTVPGQDSVPGQGHISGHGQVPGQGRVSGYGQVPGHEQGIGRGQALGHGQGSVPGQSQVPGGAGQGGHVQVPGPAVAGDGLIDDGRHDAVPHDQSDDHTPPQAHPVSAPTGRRRRAVAQPTDGTPAQGTPTHEAPAHGAGPAHGVPAPGAPAPGAAGTPAHGAPGQVQHGVPGQVQHGVPGQGVPAPQQGSVPPAQGAPVPAQGTAGQDMQVPPAPGRPGAGAPGRPNPAQPGPAHGTSAHRGLPAQQPAATAAHPLPPQAAPGQAGPGETAPGQAPHAHGTPPQSVPAQGVPAQGIPAQGTSAPGTPAPGVPVGLPLPAEVPPVQGTPAQGTPAPQQWPTPHNTPGAGTPVPPQGAAPVPPHGNAPVPPQGTAPVPPHGNAPVPPHGTAPLPPHAGAGTPVPPHAPGNDTPPPGTPLPPETTTPPQPNQPVQPDQPVQPGQPRQPGQPGQPVSPGPQPGQGGGQAARAAQPLPAEAAAAAAAVDPDSTQGRAISVRTLGQGVPFTRQAAQVQQPQPSATPAPHQPGGSGRRRKLGTPPDPGTGRPENPPGEQSPAPSPSSSLAGQSRLAPGTEGTGRSYAIGAPDENAAEGPEPLDGPGGAVEVADPPRPQPVDDELPPEPLDNPRRLLVWPAPDVSTQQALSDRGYRPVVVHSREEVDAQIAAFPAALFVDPLTGPITRTALQSLRQAAVAAEVPVLVTAGLGQASRDAAYGADPAVLLKALAPRDSEQHPPRVLLIEEHAEIALALTATLERRGMQVARAASDQDAVPLASQFRPNLVVMDLMQVHRHQAGIIDWLRANGQLNRTPLVVYTAAADQADLPRLASGETVLFLAERSTSAQVQARIVDVLARVGTN